MNQSEIQFDGGKKNFYWQVIGETIWLHFAGETYTLPLSVSSRGKSKNKASEAAGSGRVSSPMPGKILKVACQIGDKIKKSDVVIVMEAMKMEYALKADIDGVLRKLHVSSGDQVQMGQNLAEIE